MDFSNIWFLQFQGTMTCIAYGISPLNLSQRQYVKSGKGFYQSSRHGCMQNLPSISVGSCRQHFSISCRQQSSNHAPFGPSMMRHLSNWDKNVKASLSLGSPSVSGNCLLPHWLHVCVILLCFELDYFVPYRL